MAAIKALYLALLRHPRTAIAVVLMTAAIAAWFSADLSFDASSETLVVEGDREFQEYLNVAENFPSDDFLFLTVTPRTPGRCWPSWAPVC